MSTQIGTLEAVKADLQNFRRMVKLQGYYGAQVSPGNVIERINAILKEIEGAEEREGAPDYTKVDRIAPVDEDPSYSIYV